jgi:hypothetical protein
MCIDYAPLPADGKPDCELRTLRRSKSGLQSLGEGAQSQTVVQD